MVEVDEHRSVGDHALLADPHPLVRGDRALLAHHRLRADLDDALVAADLGAVADPDEAAELDPPAAGDLQFEAAAEEEQAVGAPAAPRSREEAPAQITPEQARVLEVEHPVAGAEADCANHGGRDSSAQLQRSV